MAAGFVGFEITWRTDVFSGAPQARQRELIWDFRHQLPGLQGGR